jgi:hypothetical protein
MAEKNNATCSICGKLYYKCLSCKDLMNLNPWKRHTDTSEHYKIHQAIHGYSTGVYNKEEAKIKLQMIDLSDFDSLRDNIKNIINDIMGKNETAENNTVETEDINLLNETDVFNEDVNEESIFEQTKVARKRKSLKVMETEQ